MSLAVPEAGSEPEPDRRPEDRSEATHPSSEVTHPSAPQAAALRVEAPRFAAAPAAGFSAFPLTGRPAEPEPPAAAPVTPAFAPPVVPPFAPPVIPTFAPPLMPPVVPAVAPPTVPTSVVSVGSIPTAQAPGTTSPDPEEEAPGALPPAAYRPRHHADPYAVVHGTSPALPDPASGTLSVDGAVNAPADYRQGELPLTVELDTLTGTPPHQARTTASPNHATAPPDRAADQATSCTEHTSTEHTSAENSCTEHTSTEHTSCADQENPQPAGTPDTLPTRRSLYRPLVPAPGTRSTPVVRPPVPVPPRPAASALDRSATQTLYRPTSQNPNRLLPPGRPGAPRLTPPSVPAPDGSRPGLPATPRRPRRGRRVALAALAVVGIVAGAFGGLHLGREIARDGTDDGRTAGAVTESRSSSGATVSSVPELDRAATASPTRADRGAGGMSRVGGATPGGVSGTSLVGTPGPSAAAVPVARTNLYVYWVASSPTRSLLAREYRSVPDYGDPLESAVQAVLRSRPADPDYDSPWRAAATVSVTSSATGITVTLSADAFSATGVSSGVAAAGIQQLVWTVTAAAGRDVPVTVLVAGSPGFQAWNAVALGTALRRDTRFRASVWIDTPLDSSAQHGTVRIAGQGSAFEGTYRWRISRAGRQVTAGVATGSAAGPGTGWTQFAVDVPLPAGVYQVTVSADDPGEQEMPPGWSWPDTRDFTVS